MPKHQQGKSMTSIACTLSSGEFSCEVLVPADLFYNLAVTEWMKKQGDQEFLWKQRLTTESIVVEVGGFLGVWASVISEKFNPTIYVLEPSNVYASRLGDRFFGNEKIKILPYGLGQPGIIEFSHDGAGSGLYAKKGAATESVIIKSFDQFFLENDLRQIDLMQVNIEGSEYDLIPQILSSSFRRRIIKIQIQFHLNVDDAIEKRNAIRLELAKTHTEIFCYPFVWEAWELKVD
jgi:FkbM family methyltransferase